MDVQTGYARCKGVHADVQVPGGARRRLLVRFQPHSLSALLILSAQRLICSGPPIARHSGKLIAACSLGTSALLNSFKIAAPISAPTASTVATSTHSSSPSASKRFATNAQCSAIVSANSLTRDNGSQ